jgi:hypothetical protein
MHHSYKRRPDGKYSINGRVFERLVGSRAQVWHETAYKTSGGLTRMDLADLRLLGFQVPDIVALKVLSTSGSVNDSRAGN